MKRSDLNHLRRLVAWVRCEIGQDPAEMQRTMIDIADKLGHPEVSDEGKARLVDGYRRAAAVPQYVRDAIKALNRYARAPGQTGGPEKSRADGETRVDTDAEGGPGPGRAPIDISIQTMIGWMRRRQVWPQVIVSGRMAGDIADMLSLHCGDTLYLGCARMGLAGASDDEIRNYVRLATQKTDSGHNALPMDTGSGHSDQPVAEILDDHLITEIAFEERMENARADIPDRVFSFARAIERAAVQAMRQNGQQDIHEIIPAQPSAQEVIQRAVNAIERPEGLTDTRWEYVKAGVRLLVAAVNRAAADPALKEAGHE